MSRRSLILASASPARLRLLRAAGLDPTVVVTGVPEDDVDLTYPTVAVRTLAVRKANAGATAAGDALVLGCDSMLEFDGRAFGKPSSAEQVVAQWQTMRGRRGTLVTGHCVIDAATGASVDAVCATVVRFGTPSDEELHAYAATGEPTQVAGGFTLDGFAAPFIDGIDGDAGNVIGLSLAVVRSLLSELGVEITSLWV